MYTLEADIKAESVMAVLYAAKKYDVQALVDRCRTFLKEGLDVENVCEILKQAVTFSEQKLVDECMLFIKKNAAKVMNTDGLLGVSQPVLRLVVENRFVKHSPLECYKIAKKWALKHLKADKIDDIDPKHVRDVLGDVLDVILFSDMQLNVFIENVAQENILTNSKKVSIIITINEKLKLLKDVNLHRFEDIEPDTRANNGIECGMRFTVSSPALLTGVKLFLPAEDGQTSGPLEILEGDEVVLTQNVSLNYQFGRQSQDEYLSNKIALQPDKVYFVRHRFQGAKTYCGKTPITKSCDQGITIKFKTLKADLLSFFSARHQISGLTIQVPNK